MQIQKEAKELELAVTVRSMDQEMMLEVFCCNYMENKLPPNECCGCRHDLKKSLVKKPPR